MSGTMTPPGYPGLYDLASPTTQMASPQTPQAPLGGLYGAAGQPPKPGQPGAPQPQLPPTVAAQLAQIYGDPDTGLKALQAQFPGVTATTAQNYMPWLTGSGSVGGQAN